MLPSIAPPRSVLPVLVRRLLEAWLGLLLMVVVVGGSTLWLSGGARARAAAHLSAQPVVAEVLAQQVHRRASEAVGSLRMPTLRALDGTTYSPPVAADGEPWEGLGAWSQEVRLQVFDRNAPARPLDEAFSDQSWEHGRLVQLVVTVRRGELSLGTWRWWLAP